MNRTSCKYSCFYQMIRAVLTIIVGLSIYIQSASAEFSPMTHIGAYGISPTGKIGKIGSNVQKGRVVLGFHDKENRTSHSKDYALEDIQLSTIRIAKGPGGQILQDGDYVSVVFEGSSEEQIWWMTAIPAIFGTAKEQVEKDVVIMQVEALFEDKVLLKRLEDRFNEKYTPKKTHLLPYSRIKKRVWDSGIMAHIAKLVQDLSISEFQWMADTMDSYVDCLENNICNIDVQKRSWQKKGGTTLSLFGGDVYKRVMNDHKVTSREELLNLMKKQAVQFKLLTGLANAERLIKSKELSGHQSRVYLKPLDGLNNINFYSKGKFPNAVEEIVTQDIMGGRSLVGGFLRMGAVLEEHKGGLFDDSEACNLNTCTTMNYYKDLVKPLYEVFLFELAQTQPYLVYLNWSLDERDFIRAVKKAKKEVLKTKDMVEKYDVSSSYEDVLKMYAFGTTFERIIDDFDIEVQQLVRDILELEAEHRTFWGDLKKELKKPQFWGVLGCYGITIATPAKFMNLICHAAGLSVAGHSMIMNVQKTKRLYHMQKMQMIPTEMYSDALTGLVIEGALSMLYVRATYPDINSAVRNGVSGVQGTSVAQSALAVQRGMIRNQGVKNILDQILDVLKKMMGGVVFSSTASADALVAQFLGGDTIEDMTYQRGGDMFIDRLISPGFLFSMAVNLPGIGTMLACQRKPEFPEGLLTEDMREKFEEMARLQEELECVSAPSVNEVIESMESWETKIFNDPR